MYPTIVVVLVNRQRSMVDIYSFSESEILRNREGPLHDPETRPVTVGHLSFAASVDAQSTSDEEIGFGSAKKRVDELAVDKGDTDSFGRQVITAPF